MKLPRSVISMVLILSPVLTSCTGPNPCPPEIPPSIELTVLHAETRQPVQDALAIARDGTFVDSARTRSSGQAELALNRNQEASYDVTVNKEGFQTWTRSSVQVDIDGPCRTVDTADLQVDLVPE